jgi:hypothetical protein
MSIAIYFIFKNNKWSSFFIKNKINKIIISRLSALGGNVKDITYSQASSKEDLFVNIALSFENYVLLHRLDICEDLLIKFESNNINFIEIYANRKMTGSFFCKMPFQEQLDYLHLVNEYKNDQPITKSIGYFHYLQKKHLHPDVIAEIKNNGRYIVNDMGDWYFIFLKPSYVKILKFSERIKVVTNAERAGSVYYNFGFSERKKFIDGKDEPGNNDMYHLYDNVFDPIFLECFQNTKGETMNFLGPNYYDNEKDLFHIKALLEKKMRILKEIKSFKEFIEKTTKTFFNPFGKEISNDSFISALNYEEGESWKENWQNILSNLIEVNKCLIEIVDEAIKKEKVLWVFGI